MFNKLFFRLVKRFRHSAAPGWIVLLIDMLLFTLAFMVSEAFALRSFAGLTLEAVIFKYAVSCGTILLVFLLFKSYKNIIRHMGLNDIFRVLIVCALPALILGAVNFINNKSHIIDRELLLSYRAIVMLFSMQAVLMLLARFGLLYIYNQYFKRSRPFCNVVIYGAGAAGVIANNALKQDLHMEYKVVAFVDDDATKVNQQLDSVPVMRARDVLNPKFVASKKVSQLIIAIPTSAVVLIVFSSLWYRRLFVTLSTIYLIIGASLVTMFFMNFYLWWIIVLASSILIVLAIIFFQIILPKTKNKKE